MFGLNLQCGWFFFGLKGEQNLYEIQQLQQTAKAKKKTPSSTKKTTINIRGNKDEHLESTSIGNNFYFGRNNL